MSERATLTPLTKDLGSGVVVRRLLPPRAAARGLTPLPARPDQPLVLPRSISTLPATASAAPA
jgi:hypothetical protein